MSRKRFNGYLYKYWKKETALLLLWLVGLPFGLANPYLAKLIVDKAYIDKDLKLFLMLAAIGAGVFLVNSVISAFSSYLWQQIKRGVHFDISKDVFRHLQSLPLGFFNHKSTGEHIYKIISDVNAVTYYLSSSIPQIIMTIPRAIFILVIIFSIDWRLSLFAACLIPVTYIQPYFFNKYLEEMTLHIIEKSQRVWIRLYETLSHMHLVKALGKEDSEIGRFEEDLKKSMDAELVNERFSSIRSLSGSVIDRIISGFIALYGGYLVIKGKMSLGSLSAVMIYLTQLTGLAKSIDEFYQSITMTSVSFKRLSEVIDTQPRIIDAEDARDHRISEGGIEFKNLSFRYTEKFIMQNLSFRIEPEAKIALVGPSGCGKTTLLALVLRLYEPGGGRILIDGLDARMMRLKSLKGQIGIALQEDFLWNDTIKNNILYASEDAPMDEVIRAAAIAEADDFINDFTEGYDTPIGENGCKISEGQKQRLAIARAVIRKPKILILDEAMSSLDSETEGRILNNIKRNLEDSTLILVSHRLSAVMAMETVYFFESPFNIKTGTHEQLTRENLKYRELFASQERR